MRRVSMATRDELIAALSRRYREAGRVERGRILDESVAVTGYHRKHAIRVLRSVRAVSRHAPRPGRRVGGSSRRSCFGKLPTGCAPAAVLVSTDRLLCWR
jgi:hypothetical protein